MRITLLRHPYNMQVYASRLLWNHPPTGFEVQPDKWECLGTEGFWPDTVTRYRFEAMKQAAGGLWPVWPGECSEVEVSK